MAYSEHLRDERYQMGIHDKPTARADHTAPMVGMRAMFNGMFTASQTRRICSRSLIFPVPAMIWKLIWRRKLKIRNGADQARILPDSSNFEPKNATAKSVQNNPSARLAGIAATAKYLVKNFRMEEIFSDWPSPEKLETTGNKNPMSGVTRRNGMPMRLR